MVSENGFSSLFSRSTPVTLQMLCILYVLDVSVMFCVCVVAAFVSLRSIIMVELMGLEKLTNAFGLVTMCQGLSAFIGAPIAGRYNS